MHDLPTFGLNIFDPPLVKNINNLLLPRLTQNHLTLHHIDLLLQFHHVFIRVGFLITEFDKVLFLWGELALEDLAQFLLELFFLGLVLWQGDGKGTGVAAEGVVAAAVVVGDR